MNILFVKPDLGYRTLGSGRVNIIEPLEFETLAANLPNCNVEILDMRFETDLNRVLFKFHPDVVGTTAYTVHVNRAKEILRSAKIFNKHILTLVGGIHATLLPQDFNEEFINAIVLGEGVDTVREIINRFESNKNLEDIPGLALRDHGRLHFTPARAVPPNLDDYPFPNRDLSLKYRERYCFGWWRPVAAIRSSLGCPFKCRFCATPSICGGIYTGRSPISLANELLSIKEKFVFFADDNSLWEIPRMTRLYELIREMRIEKRYFFYARADQIVGNPKVIEDWSSIGLRQVCIGIESVNNGRLRSLQKGGSVRTNEEAIKILQHNGVDPLASFVLQPDFTKDDFDAILDFINRLDIFYVSLNALTPLPGTKYYREKFSDLVTHDYELFDLKHAVLRTRMPPKEFYKQFAWLYLRLYNPLRSRTMNLATPIPLRSPVKCFQMLMGTIKYLAKLRSAYKQLESKEGENDDSQSTSIES